MKKIIFLIGIFLLIGLKINAQELTCSDFKNGKFYIPWTQKYAKISIVSNDKKDILKYFKKIVHLFLNMLFLLQT